MKTIMLIAVIFISACAYPLTHQDVMTAKGNVFIVDNWANNLYHHHHTFLRSITLTVANPTNKDVVVRAVCEFADDGELFGESVDTTIEAHSKRTLMVRGFVRYGDEQVGCLIHEKR